MKRNSFLLILFVTLFIIAIICIYIINIPNHSIISAIDKVSDWSSLAQHESDLCHNDSILDSTQKKYYMAQKSNALVSYDILYNQLKIGENILRYKSILAKGYIRYSIYDKSYVICFNYPFINENNVELAVYFNNNGRIIKKKKHYISQ